ncbi:hypothetical protein ACOMHN_015745 [Nucella lapillus]
MASTESNLTNRSEDLDYNIGDNYQYDYYYDYNESINNIPLGELVPVTLTYSLTLLLGLVGNCLVIFSISYYRKMRTVTNVFLLSLASADLLLVLVCIPIKAAAFFAYTWQFGEALCKVVNYVQNYSMVCSVLTLTVISMERYSLCLSACLSVCLSHAPDSKEQSIAEVLTTLHSMNTSLNQKMDDLKSEMSLLREELHGEVEQLRSEVRGLQKENEDLAKKVDDLQGR